jgi:type III secretion protein C
MTRFLRVLGWLAVALISVSPADAAPVPFGTAPVSIAAREMPIQAFLTDFFAQADIPVVVSPNLKGGVTGNFSGPQEDVFRRIARAFSLYVYYDGNVAHVYPADDIVTRTLAVPEGQAGQLLRQVNELQLPDRRNTIRVSREGAVIVSGAKRFVEQVEEISRNQLQRSATGGALAFRTFYLRYAWAQDVTLQHAGRSVLIPGVASMLRSLMLAPNANTSLSTNPRDTSTGSRSNVPGLRGSGLAQQGGDSDSKQPNGQVLGVLGFAPGHSSPGRGPSPSLSVDQPVGDSQRIRIEADPRLNAVVVRDTVERLDQYGALIATLDVEPQPIEIEATIIDLNTDRLRELGINWRLEQGRSSFLFGRGDASDLRLRPGQDPTPIGQGGFANIVLGSASQFIARVNALEQQGAARVVSSPQVMTLSNVEAVFDNSKTFYVRVAGRDQVDLFNVSVGTLLRVTPHVFRDQNAVRIKLLLSIEDGTISDARVDAIPVVDRATINTQALIEAGESLLIGGMIRESDTTSEASVPVLGKLPVVGGLFRSKAGGLNRSERLILITPRLPAQRNLRGLVEFADGHTPLRQRSELPPQGAAVLPMQRGTATEGRDLFVPQTPAIQAPRKP